MSSNRKTSRNRSKNSKRAGTVNADESSQPPTTPNLAIDLGSVNKSQSIVEDEENLPANNSGRATSHRDIP